MATTTYYISYGKPPRPSLWRYVLLALLFLVAAALAAGIAYGIYELASGGSSQPVAAAPEPLDLGDDVLAPIYQAADTDIFFAFDKSDSNSAHLQYVQAELLTLLENPERDNRVALASFAQVEDGDFDSVSLNRLDDPEGELGWIDVAGNAQAENRPSFIYDAIAEAYDNLESNGDEDRNKAIVLITDGVDGGYMVVDPLLIAPCPPDIPAGPGEVCNPLMDTIIVNPDELTPCPPDVPAIPGAIACSTVTGVVNGAPVSALYPVDPGDVRLCPGQTPGGDPVFCADTVVDFEPIDPGMVEPCPSALDVDPEQGCIELESVISLDELLFKLAGPDALPVKVHTIGLGSPRDHDALRLIAKATGGEYYNCTQRGCYGPD